MFLHTTAEQEVLNSRYSHSMGEATMAQLPSVCSAPQLPGRILSSEVYNPLLAVMFLYAVSDTDDKRPTLLTDNSRMKSRNTVLRFRRAMLTIMR